MNVWIFIVGFIMGMCASFGVLGIASAAKFMDYEENSADKSLKNKEFKDEKSQ